MSSLIRTAMLPAALAIALAAFIGVLGSGTARTAEAVEGDICAVYTNANHALEDGQGNEVLAVTRGVTYGLVFVVEDEEDENVEIRIDSETGSARITSKAEILGWDDDPNVGHVLVTPPAGTQVVDSVDDLNDFNDGDGNPLDDVAEWLEEVAGIDSGFVAGLDTDGDGDECGDPDDSKVTEDTDDDGWGFIDFVCIESGTFHIDILAPEDTEETGRTLKFLCGGQADRAEIKTQRTTVETQPTGVAPSGLGTSVITVTVWDQFDNRLEHAEVTFSTDNCTFRNTDPVGDNPITPAGGGTTVTTFTDTDTTDDTNFLIDNPLEVSAGTAEALLNCTLPGSTPGVAHITAIVDRPGSDIVLKVDVNVVGPTAVSGLTLTLSPDELECGETLKATAKAVDSIGNPVSPGTTIYFTTDTSSGVVGGAEGAQGQTTTIGGEASVLIATDPGNPGIHTVIAYVLNAAGTPSAQTSATYECDAAVAPAAPTVAPPATGTGTITPPSTGDAGLASGSTSSSLLVIVGAVAIVLAGLASVRFARN